jgi:DNA-binding XRE family transcriptional regulator
MRRGALLGDRLWQARLAAGLTREDLAQRAGVRSADRIRDWERGAHRKRGTCRGWRLPLALTRSFFTHGWPPSTPAQVRGEDLRTPPRRAAAGPVPGVSDLGATFAGIVTHGSLLLEIAVSALAS